MIETGLGSLEAKLGRLDRVDRPRGGDGSGDDEIGGPWLPSNVTEGSSSKSGPRDVGLLPVP